MKPAPPVTRMVISRIRKDVQTGYPNPTPRARVRDARIEDK
jgi:hypothetical protein